MGNLTVKVTKKIPMSSSSMYSGLAGTVLLGTLLGLNYTQYARRKNPLSEKGGALDPNLEYKPGALFDNNGNSVPLGATNLPGLAFFQSIRDAIPQVSPLFVCAALSTLWAVRAFGSMNRVLSRRYSDVVYQIRRPDVIKERFLAWKYVGVGGLVVPVCLSLFIAVTPGSRFKLESDSRSTFSSMGDELSRLGTLSALHLRRSDFTDSVSEFSRTLRAGFRP